MRKLVDLPNRVGFVFIGIRKDGQATRCRIGKDAHGLHRIYSVATGQPVYELLKGWTQINDPRRELIE